MAVKVVADLLTDVGSAEDVADLKSIITHILNMIETIDANHRGWYRTDAISSTVEE
jgi:hypothetical protein